MPTYKYFRTKRSKKPFQIFYSGVVIICQNERCETYIFNNIPYNYLAGKAVEFYQKYLENMDKIEGEIFQSIVIDDTKCNDHIDLLNTHSENAGSVKRYKHFDPSYNQYGNNEKNRVYIIKTD